MPTHLSAGLLGHPLHHVAALLPGDGAALLSGDVLTLLLIDIPSPCHGLVLANLVGNLLALLARLLDVIADLNKNKISSVRSYSQHQGPVSPVWEPGCRPVWRWWSTAAP